MRKAGGVKVQGGGVGGGLREEHRWGGWGEWVGWGEGRWSQKGGFEYTWVHTLKRVAWSEKGE